MRLNNFFMTAGSMQPLGVTSASLRRASGAWLISTKFPPSNSSAKVIIMAIPSACRSVRDTAITSAVSATRAADIAMISAKAGIGGPHCASNATEVTTARLVRLTTL